MANLIGCSRKRPYFEVVPVTKGDIMTGMEHGSKTQGWHCMDLLAPTSLFLGKASVILLDTKTDDECLSYLLS
jgi:hypothetical protein